MKQKTPSLKDGQKHKKREYDKNYTKLNKEKIRQRQKEWYNKNKERIIIKAYQHQIKRLYGITLETYDSLVKRQKGKCKICNQLCAKLQIDHDHSSEEIRGLLCGKCNRALGLFNENIQNLKNAILYLNGEINAASNGNTKG